MSKQYWKIKNVAATPVNFVLPLPNSGSKGVLLHPGECIVSECTLVNGVKQKTATLGVQERRKLIDIQDNFDNDLYKLTLNTNLSSASVEEIIGLADAGRNAENYMNS